MGAMPLRARTLEVVASVMRSIAARPRTAALLLVALVAAAIVVLALASSPARIAPARGSASGPLELRVGWALRDVRVRLDGRDVTPLGTRWIGTSRTAIGIHGTFAEGSIGTAASHGCIRMRIADVEQLFRHVRIGTPIRIHA